MKVLVGSALALISIIGICNLVDEAMAFCASLTDKSVVTAMDRINEYFQSISDYKLRSAARVMLAQSEGSMTSIYTIVIEVSGGSQAEVCYVRYQIFQRRFDICILLQPIRCSLTCEHYKEKIRSMNGTHHKMG